MTRQKKKKIDTEILERVRNVLPSRYVDFYPLARGMKRHFILHIGPTNSGKTHDAMLDLKTAKHGVYLGPLRLLAYEQFDNLNKEGIVCSLKTGEEADIREGATVISSTVEVLNIEDKYDVCVVDECQMVSDEDRGGAWTRAIVGVCADRIHLCFSEDVFNVIVRLIEECGDTYEVRTHERLVPLVLSSDEFSFTSSVEKGDALIVFSRATVHAVSVEVERKLGLKCSRIYGNLPYDVRHEQARKFLEGETDVLVSTDAIGMGLNLPIKRIVFLEIKKFDGEEKRFLDSSEIKQIAGRAGRFGIYDEGQVACYAGRKIIRQALSEEVKQKSSVYIDFPEFLLDVDLKLSDLYKYWEALPFGDFYRKQKVLDKRMMALSLEGFTDDKALVYKCCSFAFDVNNSDLFGVWHALCKRACENDYLPIPRWTDYYFDLEKYEYFFKLYDLYYQFVDKFEIDDCLYRVLKAKKNISELIMKELDKKRLWGKRCRKCKNELPWNWPYSLCDECYNERYNNWYDFDEYLY